MPPNGWPTRAVKPVGLANATKRLRVFARPYPLVGVITPWNMPFGMPMLDIPFALVAGAAVLTKPSEVAPLTWVEAVRGWEQIGAPPVLACAPVRRRPVRRSSIRSTWSSSPDPSNRPRHRRPVGWTAHPLQPRTRRQGPDDRARRRGRRPGGRGCRLGRPLQLRPGVHLGRARLRRPGHLRRVRRKAHGRGEQDPAGNGPRQELQQRHRSDGQPHPGRHRRPACHGCAGEGRSGPRRAARAAGVGCYYTPTVLVDVDHTMRACARRPSVPTCPS